MVALAQGLQLLEDYYHVYNGPNVRQFVPSLYTTVSAAYFANAQGRLLETIAWLIKCQTLFQMSIAIIPFATYIAGLVFSFAAKPISSRLGSRVNNFLTRSFILN